MKLIFRLVSSLLLWSCMAIFIILIVLLPRDMQTHRVGFTDVMSYHFTWNAYRNNIVEYFEVVKVQKSLGTTMVHVPVVWELAHYGERSLAILVPALLLSIIIGIYKGVFDYRHNRGMRKFLGEGSTWIGQSISKLLHHSYC